MRIDSAWRAGAAAAVVPLLLCGPVAGQEPSPSPAPSPQAERMMPPPVPVDSTPRRVVVPGRPAGPRDSVGAGRLKAWRAVTLTEGEGRVVVDGVSRKVKTGDAIAGYVVKAVGPGRVVLQNEALLAIVTFDAGGAARVHLVHTVDPTRQEPMGAPPQ